MARLQPVFLIGQAVAGMLVLVAPVRGAAPADLNGDALVDAADLALLLGAWGPSLGQPADLTGDRAVDAADLALLLGSWGPCSPPGMVLVPGGSFLMGCHNEPCQTDSVPVHPVELDEVHVDVYEVTNQQFAQYLNAALGGAEIEVVDGVVRQIAGGVPYCNTTPASLLSRITWDGRTFNVTAGKADHPMVEVSWYGAAAYCNWRSTVDGQQPCYDPQTWACERSSGGYRLPTEAEWEYAARGGFHEPYLVFPWGNDIQGSNCNYFGSGDPYQTAQPWTTPVAYYDGGQAPPGDDMAGGYGLYDMAGNVFEWCQDWYDATYYTSSPVDNPAGPATGSARVLRGGSWFDLPGPLLRCSFRKWIAPETRNKAFGFRVVR